jgi:hypothetical protein
MSGLGETQTLHHIALNDCFQQERTFPSVAAMGRN